MTCIIALREENKVIVGSDTAITSGSLLSFNNSKIVKYNNILIGFAGDVLVKNEIIRSNIFNYPLNDVNIYSAWNILRAICVSNNINGELLITDGERIVYFGNLVGFRIIEDDFCIIGNARDIAAGCLFALKPYIKDGRQRIEETLKIVSTNCNGIRAPFLFDTVNKL